VLGQEGKGLTDREKKFSSHLSEANSEVTSEVVSRRELGEMVVETPAGGDSERTALTDTSTESLSEPLHFLL
jgi:hypothetical protein